MKSHTKLDIQNVSVANCGANVGVTDGCSYLPLIGKRVAVVLSAGMLVACGGGGGGATAGSDGAISLATVTAGYTTKPTTPTTFVPVSSTATPALTAGAVITDVKIENAGKAQSNAPFTFGQVFVAGQLSTTEGLVAKLADGTLVRLQMDVKATHADGSVRHAIISGVLPSVGSGQVQTVQLAKSTVSEKSTVTPKNMLDAGLSSDITITINNTKYTASLANAVAAGTPINWLSGTTANEWIFNAPLKDAAGNVHPMLTARFDVRWYSGLTKQARVEVVVENSKTFVSGSNLTYDVNVNVAGRSVYAKTGLTHYHHARWHQSAWWDATMTPMNVQLNAAYLIASKAVSNYDQSVIPAESALAELGKQINSTNTGPMTIGPVVSYMGTTGGRPDIGPLPTWSVLYLLSGDKRARDAMMAAADGSGSWSMHYRDEKTGYPIRTDNDINKNISFHVNLAHLGPLPVPRCAVSDASRCDSPYSTDTAHEPSLVFLPYLVTGDYYYLEELQFWAATNPLDTAPGYNGYGQGLLRYQQVRGQAWSLRTLGHVAYISPDADPMKAYFTKQLDSNLNFYNQTYVVGNPNKLGMYDGSGEASFQLNGSAPWQDDFLTWAFGYLSELGFSKATPILKWKSKYPVSRMTAPDSCWILAASYYLTFRDSPTSPVYDTIGQVLAATYGAKTQFENGDPRPATPGNTVLDRECGSQAQADYLGSINGYTWPKGRMTGYADSPIGYPANMQPALAVAAGSGIENGQKAWSVYMGRANKPDFSKAPQFDIIPR